MRTDSPADTTELNATQAKWMSLQYDAPDAEKQRVFRLMERYPRVYVSCNQSRTHGIVIIDGMPLNMSMPLSDAITLCQHHSGRTDIAWCADKWINL